MHEIKTQNHCQNVNITFRCWPGLRILDVNIKQPRTNLPKFKATFKIKMNPYRTFFSDLSMKGRSAISPV